MEFIIILALISVLTPIFLLLQVMIITPFIYSLPKTISLYKKEYVELKVIFYTLISPLSWCLVVIIAIYFLKDFPFNPVVVTSSYVFATLLYLLLNPKDMKTDFDNFINRFLTDKGKLNYFGFGTSDKTEDLVSKYIKDFSILKWKSIGEIPDFPFDSYYELVMAIKDGEFLIAVDKSKANALSPFVLTKLSDIFNIIISWTPYGIIPIASFIYGILIDNYWLFLGAPIGIFSGMLSTGYAPWAYEKGPWGPFIISGIIYFYVLDIILKWWLIMSIMIPFILINSYYKKNLNAVTSAAMEDEPFFAYLYSTSSITLFNTESGESFSFIPSNKTSEEILREQIKP